MKRNPRIYSILSGFSLSMILFFATIFLNIDSEKTEFIILLLGGIFGLIVYEYVDNKNKTIIKIKIKELKGDYSERLKIKIVEKDLILSDEEIKEVDKFLQDKPNCYDAELEDKILSVIERRRKTETNYQFTTNSNNMRYK